MTSIRTAMFGLMCLIGTTVGASEPTGLSRGYPPMPEAVSSFGATVLGDSVYIFGGHMGRVSGNSKAVLSPHFARLNVKNPSAGWETLPMLETSQSPALVAWNGKIYRVGGLSFNNEAGEPTDYRSLETFGRFDPETKTWTELAPLPVPRSSMDAAVVDGKLYVVGGWDLQGKDVSAGVWHEEALVFDLADEKGSWKTIAKPPFRARALATASHQHKLYVLGGISGSRPTNEVHVYDPATDTWTTGPELTIPGRLSGFAMAAFGTNDHLYLSGGSGAVYRFNAEKNGWDPLERLFFPRSFHRLVIGPSDEVIVLGGIGAQTYLSNVEGTIPSSDKTMKTLTWDVEFAGEARHSQALTLRGSTLYAFGGNKSTKAHDFKKENFSNEAIAFNLHSRSADVLPPLPHPVQSGAAFVSGTRLDPSLYVVGGLAPTEERFGPTDVIQQYRIRSKAWSEEVKHLPAPRSMFELATDRNVAWIFGGSAGSKLATETWSWDVVDGQGVTVVEGAGIPTPRRSFAGTTFQNKYYIVGGLGERTDGKSTLVDTAHVFDFETKTWSDIAAPKHSRVFSRLAAAGGKLYLAGGFTQIDGHFAGATPIEVYDPETNTWDTVLEEFAPQLSKMTLLGYQDRLLFYSIDADQAGLAHFVLIDPAPQTDGYGPPANEGQDRSASQELAAQLRFLDKNGDGQVSLDEVGERFQQLVKRIDANGDGIASKEEIDAFGKKLDEQNRPQSGTAAGPRAAPTAGAAPMTGPGGNRERRGTPEERLNRFFEENDKDKDGVLKGDEIPERWRTNLEQVDTNKDGVLDRTEVEARFRSFGRGRNGGRPAPANPQGTGQPSPQSEAPKSGAPKADGPAS